MRAYSPVRLGAPRAIIRSTLSRARSAMSTGTVTSSRISRSDVSSLAGVIIFMYLHTAARFTGSKITSGLALRSWWSIPVSVATSTLAAVVCSAAVTMPAVDRILVRSAGTTPAPARYSALVAQPHSGWMNSSASGSAITRSRRSAPLIPACTWHSPIQMCMLSRPVRRCTWAPRNWSGQNRISWSAGIERTTSTALDDVQQMSVSAFTAAVVFT